MPNLRSEITLTRAHSSAVNKFRLRRKQVCRFAIATVRAHSSAVEQFPLKEKVDGSNPSALTQSEN